MKKVIHYCWFGGNPLSRLAKKCLKSWKKYLPDYEIIEWNENNFDVNECPFIKEAYENKKWAFVADYARTKAIYEMGGIYFDTDMMITKDISFLLDKDTFLGVEDSMMVNAAVWGAKEPHSFLATKLLEFYKSQEHFNLDDMYKVSIPRIITKILDEYDFDPSLDEVQVLHDDIYVYPRPYFYPLSFDFKDNKFTEDTCMCHYFDASWVPKYEQREAKLIRKIGKRNTQLLFATYRFCKRNGIRALKLLFLPVYLYRKYKRKISNKYLANLKKALEDINNVKEDYVVFYNPEWFGVANATIELFNSTAQCGELLRKKDIKKIGNLIIEKGIKQVVFSAMCIGWKDLAIYLKENSKDIKVKTFWHGNHSQVSEPYGWDRNIEIIELHKQGIIDVMGTCKESIMEFYKNEGYKCAFLTNKVVLKEKVKGNRPKDEVRIGIYAAKCDDWRKNLFTQIAAASLIDNAVIDMVPVNPEAKALAEYLGVKIEGLDKPIPREELIKRMANNTINLYVTFSECAPMLPLESFEVGVPCITGNNHHYFKDNELEDYLVVKNEENPCEVAEIINKVIKNEKKVMELYKTFKKNNDEASDNDVKAFLEM